MSRLFTLQVSNILFDTFHCTTNYKVYVSVLSQGQSLTQTDYRLGNNVNQFFQISFASLYGSRVTIFNERFVFCLIKVDPQTIHGVRLRQDQYISFWWSANGFFFSILSIHLFRLNWHQIQVKRLNHIILFLWN